jgi:hypothetical protein
MVDAQDAEFDAFAGSDQSKRAGLSSILKPDTVTPYFGVLVILIRWQSSSPRIGASCQVAAPSVGDRVLSGGTGSSAERLLGGDERLPASGMRVCRCAVLP